MSLHPSFGKAAPVTSPDFPIVLRFAGLHPANLGKFRMHDKRKGGDLSHVDHKVSFLNEVLYAEPRWQETLRAKIAQVRHDNFREHAEALRAKNRKKELAALMAEGMSDPWKRCTKSSGPLREGILTVNKEWFGGTGTTGWDPLKVKRFRATVMDFLQEHFPDGQLLYASAHADEEAWHVHFVVAAWTERITANRGRQVLLQASVNPLLQNYEYAQTLAGEAFASLGIIRGERRAEAARLARATGQEPPPKRWHVPPSQWREMQLTEGQQKATEIVTEARQQAREIIEDGRGVAKGAIKKSRKRAIREANARKAEAARHLAAAKRQEQEMEKMALAKIEAATATLATVEGKISRAIENGQGRLNAIKEETASVTDLRDRTGSEVQAAEIALSEAQSGLDAARTSLQRVRQEEQDITERLELLRTAIQHETAAKTQAQAILARARAERIAEEGALAETRRKQSEIDFLVAQSQKRLESVQEDLSIAEILALTLKECMDLLEQVVLVWIRPKQDETARPRLAWGPNAPQDVKERQQILERIKPAVPRLEQLGLAITRTVEQLLGEERRKLARDAALVADLRDDWDDGQKAALERIQRDGGEPGMG